MAAQLRSTTTTGGGGGVELMELMEGSRRATRGASDDDSNSLRRPRPAARLIGPAMEVAGSYVAGRHATAARVGEDWSTSKSSINSSKHAEVEGVYTLGTGRETGTEAGSVAWPCSSVLRTDTLVTWKAGPQLPRTPYRRGGTTTSSGRNCCVDLPSASFECASKHLRTRGSLEYKKVRRRAGHTRGRWRAPNDESGLY